MEQSVRQTLHATLSRSSLSDIKSRWQDCLDDFDYEVLRQPETGTVVKSVAQVSPGDHLSVRVADGEFETTVD